MLPHIMCKLITFAEAVSINSNIMTLMAISIHYYFIILYPFKSNLTTKKCYFTLISIWIISGLFGLINLLNYDVNTRNECGPIDLKYFKIQTLIEFVLQFIIPIVIFLTIVIRVAIYLVYQNEILFSRILWNQPAFTQKIKVILLY